MDKGLSFAKIGNVAWKSLLTLAGVAASFVVSGLLMLLHYSLFDDMGKNSYGDSGWTIVSLLFALVAPVLLFAGLIGPKIWEEKETPSPPVRLRRDHYFFDGPEGGVGQIRHFDDDGENMRNSPFWRLNDDRFHRIISPEVTVVRPREVVVSVDDPPFDPTPYDDLEPERPAAHETIRLYTVPAVAGYIPADDPDLPVVVPERSTSTEEIPTPEGSTEIGFCDTLPKIPVIESQYPTVAGGFQIAAYVEPDEPAAEPVDTAPTVILEPETESEAPPFAEAAPVPPRPVPIRIIETEDATIEIMSEEEIIETDEFLEEAS